jgi:predicted nucleotidyltransferase
LTNQYDRSNFNIYFYVRLTFTRKNGMSSRIKLPKGKITKFCKANHILKLSLFGSVLRDDFREDSDLDILVEFEPGKVAGLIGLSRMERQLSEILGGRKVDLRTPHDLSKYFRDEVLANAEAQYAAA